jgi:hypothetical protein
MRRIVNVLFLLFIGSLCFGQSPNPAKQQLIAYKAGQVWKFNDLRFNDPTITILKVESHPKVGNIIHVRIDKLPAGDCGNIHLTSSIEHLAVTESSLRSSAYQLLEENVELPDAYFDAYRRWDKKKKPKILKSPLRDEVISSVGAMICNLLPVQAS